MKKKRLLIFHPALAPYRIDQFNFISDIFDLHVVFLFDNVWNHKFDQEKLQKQLTFNFSFLLTGPRFKGRVFRFGILKTIKKYKPDIILGYEYSFLTQYLILLKKTNLIKQLLGTTVDDSIEICNNVQSAARSFARKSSLKELDYLVVLSKEVATFYIDKFGFEEKNIIISPILQNPDRLRKDDVLLIEMADKYLRDYNLINKKVLLFVGRFIPEKGILNFIEIISSLLIANKDLVFMLVGDGLEKYKIEEAITKKTLQHSIILPGRFEGTDLLAWYLACSGFVLPSLYEPFGAVVNEALIFGLPVFSSKYVGSAYLLNEPTDCVFNPNDKEDCLLKLKNFISKLPNKSYISTSLPIARMGIDFLQIIENWNPLLND